MADTLRNLNYLQNIAITFKDNYVFALKCH